MTVADIIEADFAPHYNSFVPMMTDILVNVESSSMNNKKLRAKAIETIGSIISSISEFEQKSSFTESVTGITSELAKILQGKL